MTAINWESLGKLRGVGVVNDVVGVVGVVGFGVVGILTTNNTPLPSTLDNHSLSFSPYTLSSPSLLWLLTKREEGGREKRGILRGLSPLGMQIEAMSK